MEPWRKCTEKAFLVGHKAARTFGRGNPSADFGGVFSISFGACFHVKKKKKERKPAFVCVYVCLYVPRFPQDSAMKHVIFSSDSPTFFIIISGIFSFSIRIIFEIYIFIKQI